MNLRDFHNRPCPDIAGLLDAHVNQLRESSGSGDFDADYYSKHRSRFIRTGDFIPWGSGGHALEVGATDLFQVALKFLYGYGRVSGTHFSTHIEEKIFQRRCVVLDNETSNLSVSINLENDIFPFEAESLDFILCGEVIEHLDIDPMFMLSEFNRILKPGGALLITTPNCCSARNFWKIAHGYRPHFFMQYERSRSPYRHNLEYDVHALVQIIEAAGFLPMSVETFDVFEEPMPEALRLLEMAGLTLDHRGDGIFALSEKRSGVVDRWPDGIYV